MKIRIIKPTKLGTLIFILFSWKSTLDEQKRVRPKVSDQKKKEYERHTQFVLFVIFYSKFCKWLYIMTNLGSIKCQANFSFRLIFCPTFIWRETIRPRDSRIVILDLIHISSSTLEEKGKYYEIDQQNYSIPSSYIMIICKKRWAKLWE